MDEILIFLLKYCSDFYKKYGFKFSNSEVTPQFGGNAYLMLENDNLKIRFIIDRGQLMLEFFSKFDKKRDNWYSIDLVRQLISGEDEYYALLDDNNGQFIQKNLDKIIEMFRENVITQTIEKLNLLKKRRAKILFG